MAGGLRRCPSLRLRITAGALVVVVAASCGAARVVVGVVERKMVRQIDSTLTANTDFIERSMKRGTGLPMGEGPTDLYVQFVAADGRVLGASTAAQGLPALARPGRSAGGLVNRHDRTLGELRVLARPAPTSSRVTLVVARSADSVSDMRASLFRLLVMMVPRLSMKATSGRSDAVVTYEMGRRTFASSAKSPMKSWWRWKRSP